MLEPKIAPENAKDVLEDLEGLWISATGGGALCSPNGQMLVFEL